LIFPDAGGAGTTLANVLGQRGGTCLMVRPGLQYERHDANTFTVDPSNHNDFVRVCNEARAIRSQEFKGVIHLWSLENENPEGDFNAESLERAAALSCGSVLHVLQAIAAQDAQSTPWLLVVTRNAVHTGNEQQISVSQSPVWGLARVAATEYPAIWRGIIDLGPEPVTDQVAAVLAEIAGEPSEKEIAVRAGEELVPRLTRFSPATERRLEIRGDGTYLITGGRGILGMQVAEWLAGRGAKHLILSGRHEPSPSALTQIARLRAASAEVRLMNADVASLIEMTQLFEQAAQQMPGICGIIHAAGILDDGILQRQDWSRFRRVLAPKMAGAWNLHALSRGLPLDFFVLFSSASALFGAQGQGNYSAANSFLDSLASHRRISGLPALSINWGPWAQEGMAGALDNRSKDRLKNLGIELIRPEEGLAALGTLMEAGSSQGAVIRIDWSIFARRTGITVPSSLISDLVREKLSIQIPAPAVLQRIRRSENARGVLQQYILEEVGRVLGLGAEEALDLRQGFSKYGMDSLMAVELKNRLEASLSVRLHSTVAFEYPTLESLAGYLGDKLFPGASRAMAAQAAAAGEPVLQTEIADLHSQRTEDLEDFINRQLRELIQ
jgi:NAD(P)-dependent dehydrogenase (short-subunit alcohol dehydrogenase family)/acyl carrier protein